MPDRPGHHHRHRFPSVVIAHAVWLDHRFALSLRDIEELLYERGIVVTYETVRAWVAQFDAPYAAELRQRAAPSGRTWHVAAVFTRVRGQPVYRWRAVDDHGQVLDVLVQAGAGAPGRGSGRALRRARAGPRGRAARSDRDGRPRALRRGEGAAKARVPDLVAVEHRRVRAAARLNHRVEPSHQPTRLREYVRRRFKSSASAQRFLAAFRRVCNHFRLRRHLLTAGAPRAVRHRRHRRHRRHAAWRDLVAGATAASMALDAPKHRSARLARG